MTEPHANRTNVADSYTAAAEGYTEKLFHELDGKPLDRLLLADFARKVRSGGLTCDLGCGPGQIAAYLKTCGVWTCGIDLSPGMVTLAKQRSPEIGFECGDILSLKHEQQYSGVAAFYSIVHFHGVQLDTAFANIFRSLEPGGVLLLAFHMGTESKHVSELFGATVDLDFYFHVPSEIAMALMRSGWVIDRIVERGPYPDAEYPSRRCYSEAHRPADQSDRQPTNMTRRANFVTRFRRKASTVLRRQS